MLVRVTASLHALPPFLLFFFNATATTEIYTLSLHDALPIYQYSGSVAIFGFFWYCCAAFCASPNSPRIRRRRSEEHTSELQSRVDLVCRLLLEKKKKNNANKRPRK